MATGWQARFDTMTDEEKLAECIRIRNVDDLDTPLDPDGPLTNAQVFRLVAEHCLALAMNTNLPESLVRLVRQAVAGGSH